MTLSAFETQTCQITFSLPSRVKILIKKGDKVKEGELLAEVNEEQREFNLAGKRLLVPLGAEVKENQIVAEKKSFLGKSIFKSPVSGTLVSLTPEGVLKIKVAEKQEVKAPVEGVVEDAGSDGLTLGFSAAVFRGDRGVGGTNWGKIEILEPQAVDLDSLPSETAEKILIFSGKLPVALVYKAEALGAAGIVGGSLGGEVKPHQMAVLTAGDKENLISPEIWDNLKKYQGKKALISGSEKTLKIPL